MIERLRAKHLDAWLPGYVRHLVERARLSVTRPRGPRHVLFALCDHFEPGWGDATAPVAAARVQAWEDAYPALAREFADADGRPPRHSFFFPGEQYEAGLLDALARLAARGLGEVELHLHHDGDDAPTLRARIAAAVEAYGRHGHLARDPDGRHRYAFIHGNWALANARRDGRWCGVDAELPLLFHTGCYADFTFPAAPDECQPAIVNRIYWPAGDLARRRSYEAGVPARVGELHGDRILMVQGPLCLALRPRSLRPRIEAGALSASDPASEARVRSWIAQGIHVAGRPEWLFVKVHTHGAPERQAESLLGAGGRALHRALSRWNDGREHVLHYVTAREMWNIAVAAMEGREGDPNAFRDYRLPPPPAARRHDR